VTGGAGAADTEFVAEESLVPLIDPRASPKPDSLTFAFAGGRMVVARVGGEIRVPDYGHLSGLLGDPPDAVYMGRLGGRDCFVLSLPEGLELGTDLVVAGLRELYSQLPEQTMAAAGRAFQTLEWYHAHAYCGRCGTPTELSGTEMARACPACGALHFPRVTPAVIMLVEKDGELLLARNRRFAGLFYSVLAGFVEPGETLEQAVAREVREEVGVEVTDIRYFGSQSWPFPSQLMIGFLASFSAGKITVDGRELIEAGWFTADRLRKGDIQLPGPFSIARRLIEHWLVAHSRPPSQPPPAARGEDVNA
jgi:NAD+ diphosphatase